jgi:hypothetical protein
MTDMAITDILQAEWMGRDGVDRVGRAGNVHPVLSGKMCLIYYGNGGGFGCSNERTTIHINRANHSVSSWVFIGVFSVFLNV